MRGDDLSVHLYPYSVVRSSSVPFALPPQQLSPVRNDPVNGVSGAPFNLFYVSAGLCRALMGQGREEEGKARGGGERGEGSEMGEERGKG